jgi:hypothetical protein
MCDRKCAMGYRLSVIGYRVSSRGVVVGIGKAASVDEREGRRLWKGSRWWSVSGGRCNGE